VPCGALYHIDLDQILDAFIAFNFKELGELRFAKCVIVHVLLLTTDAREFGRRSARGRLGSIVPLGGRQNSIHRFFKVNACHIECGFPCGHNYDTEWPEIPDVIGLWRWN
jgi:hypothetical protein